MLKRRLVAALLLVLPATVGLSATSFVVQAAEECRATPSSAAPKGSRWLYRINRADHRRCWFLGSGGVGLHTQQARRHSHLGGESDAKPQDQHSEVEAASVPIGKSPVVATAELQSVPQIATPAVEQASENLIPRSVPIIVYKQPSASSETVRAPAAAKRGTNRASVDASKSKGVLIAGAAAAGLLFAGGAFLLKGRVYRRSDKHALSDRRSVRSAIGNSSSVAQKLAPIAADLATEQIHRKLERDLNRVFAATNSSRSDRRQPSSSGAISLPHASAWLSRVYIEPSANMACSCNADA